MAHKSFKRAQNLDPVYFEVPGEGEQAIRFNCEDDIPGGVIFAFTEVISSNDEDDGDDPKVVGGVLQGVRDLFDAAIVPEQHAQFWALTKAKKHGISLSMMMDIAMWLAQEYSSRPTGPTSAAGQSARQSGSGSTDGAYPTVTTYSKPALVAPTT